eukprot:GILI01003852.1.p1 GENE.GILI01003852.1~~GILI01003852.1.p1  ORF type:complete len:159 (+),score=64.54 GILI01003852.1:51-479(+)
MFRFTASPIARLSAASLALVSQRSSMSFKTKEAIKDAAKIADETDSQKKWLKSSNQEDKKVDRETELKEMHAQQEENAKTWVSEAFGNNNGSAFNTTSGAASNEEVVEQKNAKNGYRKDFADIEDKKEKDAENKALKSFKSI